MKKTIYMTMTSERARERGFDPHLSLAHIPVEIELDALTPVARWIAEHITATRVLDEARDIIHVYAIAGFSMAERDRRAGRTEEYVNRMTERYGDYYTQAMRTDGISFPIYGRSHHRPEDVIEQTARELAQSGAVRLVDRHTNDCTDI